MDNNNKATLEKSPEAEVSWDVGVMRDVAPNFDWVSEGDDPESASTLTAQNCPNVRVQHLEVEETNRSGRPFRYHKFRFEFRDEKLLVVKFLHGELDNSEEMDVKFTQMKKFTSKLPKKHIPFGETSEAVAGLLFMENDGNV